MTQNKYIVLSSANSGDREQTLKKEGITIHEVLFHAPQVSGFIVYLSSNEADTLRAKLGREWEIGLDIRLDYA